MRIILSIVFVLLLLPLFIAAPLCAQTPSYEPKANAPELDALLVEAAENNPALRAAFANWRAAVEQSSQAGTPPDPRLNFGYFIRSVETRTGPQRASIGISQSLPWYGTLSLRTEAAEQRAEALHAEVQAERLALFARVKAAWYEYAYLGRALRITREQVELLAFLERVANARYSAGLTANADVIRIQVELATLEDRLHNLHNLREPLVERINALTDRAPGTPLDLPRTIPVLLTCETDGELAASLAEGNPRVTAAARRVDAQQTAIRLADKNFYPDVTFGLSTIITDEAINPGQPDSGKDPVIASVGLSLPIWFESRRAAVREAESQHRSRTLAHKALVNDLQDRLSMVLYRYREASRRIGLYADSLVPKARQALGVSLEAYQAGEGTALELLDAEKTLMELALSYHRALADQATYLAELEALVGRDIPCEVRLPADDEPLTGEMNYAMGEVEASNGQ